MTAISGIRGTLSSDSFMEVRYHNTLTCEDASDCEAVKLNHYQETLIIIKGDDLMTRRSDKPSLKCKTRKSIHSRSSYKGARIHCMIINMSVVIILLSEPLG